MYHGPYSDSRPLQPRKSRLMFRSRGEVEGLKQDHVFIRVGPKKPLLLVFIHPLQFVLSSCCSNIKPRSLSLDISVFCIKLPPALFFLRMHVQRAGGRIGNYPPTQNLSF